MIDLYARGGFQEGTVLMDNEFEKLQNLVTILAINTTAAKEHVPEVERKIRLIKERGRGILNTLPFKKMPRLVLIELVYHVVLWLNAFPAKSGLSETPSTRETVYRHKLDFTKHCKSPFGTYCEVHDEPTPTNTMVTRSTPAIVLGLRKLVRDLQVSQLGDWKEGQATSVHAVPHARLSHQEGRSQSVKSTSLPGIFDFANRNGILFEWNKEVDKFPKRIV
jgi:hypothetical protein